MTAASRRPPLYTIAPGIAFVDALAAGMLMRAGTEPEALACATVLLPTRRACRALAEAFLRRSGGRPLLLPRLAPLGDIDEDEIALAGDEGDGIGEGALDLSPAIGGLRRILLLARLVLREPTRHPNPEQAVRLAGELARLIDHVRTERLDFAKLRELAPERFAEHWQKTLAFLRIVVETWPKVLAEENALDPSERRNRLLAAQAAAWRARPPPGPVIVAGTTGTVPATADLLEVVLDLPEGKVVLPGLDRDLDDAAWDRLGPDHPQYNMARLLKRLDVARGAVADWPAPGTAEDAKKRAAARARIASAAFRPADADPVPVASGGDGLDGVRLIECPGPHEEAGAIALLLREAIETPGRTAALVTPDRSLARRVAAELRRFGIEIDDSAGVPLGHTPPGSFLSLTARMAGEAFAPVPLLAALKHPLAAGGLAPGEFRRRVRAIEREVLRGPRPAAGLDGLAAAIRACGDADIRRMGKQLVALLRSFAEIAAGPRRPLAARLESHIRAAETLAASDDESGAARLWAGEAGEAAATFMAEAVEAASGFDPVAGQEYPALLSALMAGRPVRPRFGRHPRLHVWGLLEARLQHADVLVLGGLNEGSWPPETQASPWMSRPMMKEFGLPLPERRIGLAAHDFAQAFAAPQVWLTRATRVGGAPTVPSRWLLKIGNLLARAPGGAKLADDGRWLAWLAALDRPKEKKTIRAPRPTPPVAARPRTLSVTKIETWIRDPYAIFADQILGLHPLSPLDEDPTAAERGSIIHAALERFVKEHPDALPPDAVERLIAIGREEFAHVLATPGVRAFWWPRFVRVAAWFVEYERQRRAGGAVPIAIEAKGEMKIAAPAGPFTLTARADRIDRLAAGSFSVIDYKTGQPPSWPQVKTGLAPQLSLEAAMIAEGGFAPLSAGAVAELIYLRLSGGREPGAAKEYSTDVAEVATDARARLARRVAAFDDPKTPYLSRMVALMERLAGDYDHLARVKEWLSGDQEGE